MTKISRISWGGYDKGFYGSNTASKILIDLSCSISGSENIEYQISKSSGSPAPSWIYFDTANRVLVINTTSVSTGTSDSFIIKSTNKNYPIWDKIVNLQIVSWAVKNWLTCQSNNPNKWLKWNDDYNLSNDSSSCLSDSLNTISEMATTATQSIIGAVAGATALFSFWNMSSPQGIWIALNQFQLILLLLLTNSHIPKSIVNYLTGMKATTCSLNFIPFKDIPGVKILLNWFDYDLTDSNLESFGIFSGSSLLNNFSLIWVFVIIIVGHNIFHILFKCIQFDRQARPKWAKLYDRIRQLFLFTIYIRLMLEADQFMILSSFEELKVWNWSSTSRIASLKQ